LKIAYVDLKKQDGVWRWGSSNMIQPADDPGVWLPGHPLSTPNCAFFDTHYMKLVTYGMCARNIMCHIRPWTCL